MPAAEPINRLRALLAEDPEAAARSLARFRAGEFDATLADAVRGLRNLIRDGSARHRLAACEAVVQLKMVEIRHSRPVYDGTTEPILSPLGKPGEDMVDDEEEEEDEGEEDEEPEGEGEDLASGGRKAPVESTPSPTLRRGG